MVIKVYLATASGSTAIKKKQQDVVGFLEALKVDYTEFDIATNEENRMWMRENVPGEKKPTNGIPLPPQIFNDQNYCGDYDTFFNAKEDNEVFAFLGLAPPAGSKEAQLAEKALILQNGKDPEEHHKTSAEECNGDSAAPEDLHKTSGPGEAAEESEESMKEPSEKEEEVEHKDEEHPVTEDDEEHPVTEDEEEEPITEDEEEEPVTEEEEEEEPVTEDEEQGEAATES
ncbi:SH3 domain-binding glutamic acid-rich protein-like isoform X16 [Acipenser ruthenus]|uniref:SH3 domain-binding glutamic acid-rich protein-like isoform X17 n=1 Tax=Acipenser ruthenus TaxID=7906 RepID=UPI002741F9B7|nr:SH3 domain-binding glutamic acid-rich protein-like isoform X17 [Acipenser ruthenus]XP_058886801.1 SH3 domain-binding glutamic acid-rich protein-like isoform X16 [Acipenser ruthenus]